MFYLAQQQIHNVEQQNNTLKETVIHLVELLKRASRSYEKFKKDIEIHVQQQSNIIDDMTDRNDKYQSMLIEQAQEEEKTPNAQSILDIQQVLESQLKNIES